MGRPLLSLVLLAALAACDAAPASAPSAPAEPGAAALAASAPPRDPHAELSCSGCHRGPSADSGRAAVPAASCTTAGCHADGGPAEVDLGTVEFHHREHGATGDVPSSCAGCHTHDEGGEPLRASVDACALCHVAEVASDQPQDCQLCHVRPDHSALSSAGVAVQHGTLPWTEMGCVRCHYDVADPPVSVSVETCAGCHADAGQVARDAAGTDLHPSHLGLACTACHAEGTHHVRAMSSAVELACGDCHAGAHSVTLAGGDPTWTAAQTCAECHTGVHAAQQRLLLGQVLEERTFASRKFLVGMTCRSCHVPPAAGISEEPIRGQAQSCQGCHGPEYRTVLGWWLEGVDRRLAQSTAYVDGARVALSASGSDSAKALTESASAMLALVREAGGQHNLELADRVFRESVERARTAYRVAGRTPPPPPALGSPPHYGLCSGCHYGQDGMDLRTMDDDLHRRLMQRPDARD